MTNHTTRTNFHRKYDTSFKFYRWIFDRLPAWPDIRILDIGCGGGDLWFENQERIPDSWRLTLLDKSPETVRRISSKLDATLQKLQGYTLGICSIEELSPANWGTYDVVIANHMLHYTHVPAAMKSILSVLKPTGLLYASADCPDHMQEVDSVTPAGIPTLAQSKQTFNTETGGKYITPLFDRVIMETMPRETLRISYHQDIVDYILAGTEGLDTEDRTNYTTEILHNIRANSPGGIFVVTRASGMFRCHGVRQ
jgi:SAM-dependent methyltransferase